MSSFMHEDIVGRRRAERERCNDAARRSKGPLLVGYINAANYYGAPIPDIARYLLMPCTPVFPVPTNADESKAWSSMCLRENWISAKGL